MINKTFKDLSGKRYGRLTVLKRIGSTKNKKSLFLCQCDCGRTVEVIGGNLESGTTSSCGCYKLQAQRERANPHRRRLKRIHRLMIARCCDPRCKSFRYYGSRGIEVCKEWLESFDVFYSWAMQNGYSNDLTIDRINNNGKYEPSNCRWATFEEQANNTRKVHWIEYQGETMSISAFARKIGTKPRKANYLIHCGYTPQEIARKVKEHE